MTSGSEMKSMSTTGAWGWQPTLHPATNSMSASSGGGRTTAVGVPLSLFKTATATNLDRDGGGGQVFSLNGHDG